MEMEKLVALCKRRGFLFQSSEIYGGLNGFWDYGPLGVELKRNIKEAWWRDMVTAHDDLSVPAGAPEAYEMVGLDSTIIMHPQVWKVSGHYDLFVDKMVDCLDSKKRYRFDHIYVAKVKIDLSLSTRPEVHGQSRTEYWGTLASTTDEQKQDIFERAGKQYAIRSKHADEAFEIIKTQPLPDWLNGGVPLVQIIGPDVSIPGRLIGPRDFNLMFPTTVGALGGEDDRAYLRPETAQGIFVNFKNVLDSTRVRIPFGIAQIGKSFRNEITPRYLTFRSREFEQMEIEFFCHPGSSHRWYKYWRDRRMKWYVDLGLAGERLRLREHEKDELSHYSTGTADIEYAFPFLPEGEFGELEGIAHRGDFDLRSHMEGKLDEKTCPLQVQLGPDGKPKWRGSGKDLTYFDADGFEQAREKLGVKSFKEYLATRQSESNPGYPFQYTPHVIEPSAGADRAALAFLCEAYAEDEQPDEKGALQKRTVMQFHPRVAPIKCAVFPLVKKDGMPEIAKDIYRALKPHFNVFYDEKGAVGRRYRRQDEAGTPFCITVDGDTLKDHTVTIRDRDSLEQIRVKVDDCVDEIRKRLV